MFADDTKIWRGIYTVTVEDQESLQDDLDRLMSWSEEWLLKFNPEKCKLMRIGHGLQTEYEMTRERNKSQTLGFTGRKGFRNIADNLKPGLQCAKAASKAMSVLGMIRRRFGEIDRESFQLLYKTYVRLHMEYGVQAWSP